MDTTFVDSGKSEISDTHRLLLNFPDKTDLKGMINMLVYQILTDTIYTKIKKVIQKQ